MTQVMVAAVRAKIRKQLDGYSWYEIADCQDWQDRVTEAVLPEVLRLLELPPCPIGKVT